MQLLLYARLKKEAAATVGKLNFDADVVYSSCLYVHFSHLDSQLYIASQPARVITFIWKTIFKGNWTKEEEEKGDKKEKRRRRRNWAEPIFWHMKKSLEKNKILKKSAEEEEEEEEVAASAANRDEHCFKEYSNSWMHGPCWQGNKRTHYTYVCVVMAHIAYTHYSYK